ncbi:hypothetical protein NGB58_27915, partial [Escherichia coli]|nr:hypothetical protein [Escherichia coli]
NTNVTPSPGGEDMSWFIKNDKVGCCYFMIGSEGSNLHTSDFDDTIIPVTASMLVKIVNRQAK